MTTYIARRILQLIPVLLLVSAIVFFVFRIIPGDAAVMQLGVDADPAQVKILQAELGLDKPLYVQYARWLGGALHGDLGKSYLNEQPVLSLVLEKFPATLELAVLGSVLSLIISVPVGVISAVRRGSWIDQISRVLALAGYCVPRYWLAVLLILFFAVKARWVPAAGYADVIQQPLANLQYAALPVVSLAVTLAAVQMRYLRSSLLDVIAQDYVRTALAKGLPHRTAILRHALKNALIPFVTVVGLEFANLLGGLVVIEQIFSWPGVGWLMIESITERDYAVVQGVVLLVTIGFVLINLLVDIAYAYLDPRIRYA